MRLMRYHSTFSTIAISIVVLLVFASVALFTVAVLSMTSPTLIATQELLKELEEHYAQLERYIAAINRTNSRTLVEGVPLSDLLARRDCWKKKLQGLRDFLDCASELAPRRTVGEIKIRSTVNVRAMQKEIDWQAKELRELDEKIQEANWTTELME